MENNIEGVILKPGKNSDAKVEGPALIRKHFPGQNIKPVVDEETAIALAQKLYGITARQICPLNSYDDQNFLIFADK